MSIPIRDDRANDLDFEISRFDFCEKMYRLEKVRKEDIEKKAQFYFSVVVFLVGALSFKGSVVTLLGSSISKGRLGLASESLIIVLAVIFGAFTFGTLVAVAKTLAPSSYPKPYPRRFSRDYFGPTSNTVGGSRASLMKENAMRFALATEVSRESNANKSQWLIRTHRLLLSSVVALVALLVALAIVPSP